MFNSYFYRTFAKIILQTRDCKLMSTKISHSGVIERIEPDKVQVRIVQTSACAACKVASYCCVWQNCYQKFAGGPTGNGNYFWCCCCKGIVMGVRSSSCLVGGGIDNCTDCDI